MNPFSKIDSHIMDDTDLFGPVVFCLAFGMFLLISGRLATVRDKIPKGFPCIRINVSADMYPYKCICSRIHHIKINA